MTPVSRRLWANWLLVVVALAMTGLVIGTQRAVTSAEREGRARHVLVAFHDDAIDTVVLTMATESLGISRGQGAEERWLLKPPLAGKADEASVDQLFRSLRYATWLRQVPEDTPRAAFGLDAPSYVIELLLGADRVRLRLGGPAPEPTGARYLEVAGEGAPNRGVYVISESTARDLSPALPEFRARQLVPYGSRELAQLEIGRFDAGKQQSLRLKNFGTHFRFQGSHQDALVDRFVMDRLFVALSGLQAQNFVTLEQARAVQGALDKAAVTTLTFTLAQRAEGPKLGDLRVTIGGACPVDSSLQLAVRDGTEAVAACVRSAELLGVLSSQAHWVERRLVQARVDEVEQISVTQGQRRLEVVRREDGFLMRAPEEARLEPDAGQRLLSELTSVKGAPVGQSTEAGSELQTPFTPKSPSHQVRILRVAQHEQEPIAELFEVGVDEPEAGVLVRRVADGLVLRVSRQTARLFEANKLLLKDRQLLDVATEKIQRVSLSDPPQELLQTARGVFELTAPKGYEPDGALAHDLIAAVSQLSADRWVAEEADDSMGFRGAAQVTIRYAGDAGDAKVQLEVGGRVAGGGYYARWNGAPEVFILGATTHEVLTTWLLDRSAFLIDPTQTQRLRITNSRGASAEFERGADQLALTRAEPELDSRAAQELLTTLGLLRAEAAVSLTGPEPHQGFDRPLIVAEFSRGNPAEPGGLSAKTWQVGAGDTYRGLSIYYARIVGEPAIFALPRQSVQQILGAM